MWNDVGQNDVGQNDVGQTERCGQNDVGQTKQPPTNRYNGANGGYFVLSHIVRSFSWHLYSSLGSRAITTLRPESMICLISVSR
jgi:hypothetical protein